MELYHGSTEIVEQPGILKQQRLLDFGKGFYVTTSREQAERWALIKAKRASQLLKPIVNVYQASDNLLDNLQLKTKVFTEANKEWLDFILRNRNNHLPHAYDLVMGPVANDTLYQTLTLYENGILTKPETISRLKAHRLFDQLSFNTKNAIKWLNFLEMYEVAIM